MTETSKPTVHEAWSSVMADVQGIRKGELAQAGPARFNFRGIDAVMNAVGPALRAHGVHVTPSLVNITHRDTATSNGKATKETVVTVTYRVTGPAGDSFEGTVPGEALDNGDKGTAKAMSVAYRTFLLQSLTVPTDEPDPDTFHYERQARDWPAEVAACQSVEQLRALWPQLPPELHELATARAQQLTPTPNTGSETTA